MEFLHKIFSMLFLFGTTSSTSSTSDLIGTTWKVSASKSCVTFIHLMTSAYFMGSQSPFQHLSNNCHPKLIRDSRTKDVYLGGPISLANHACSKHSNCVLNLNDGVRLDADIFIMSGQRVYICYSSDEEEIARTRGFRCAVCVR